MPHEEGVEYGIHLLPIDVFFPMMTWDVGREEVSEVDATNSF
jgi:hypothetical protein